MEEKYASVLFKESVEKKRKERKVCLQELKESWIFQLTKEHVEDCISLALTKGSNRAILIEITDLVRDSFKGEELDSILVDLEKHVSTLFHIKGMSLTYRDMQQNLYTVWYSNLYIEWSDEDESSTCICQ